MRRDLLQPVVGPKLGPSLADQLRLVRALAGTTHRRGVEDLQNAAAYAEQIALDTLGALKALLPEIDQEIEQRQTSGLDEYWQDLKALSDAGHAAVAIAEGRYPATGTASDAYGDNSSISISVSRMTLWSSGAPSTCGSAVAVAALAEARDA